MAPARSIPLGGGAEERDITKAVSHVAGAILVGVQIPGIDDDAHAASLAELGRLVNTLGYEVVGTISQKRDELDGATVLGKGRLEELAAITGGIGIVGSAAHVRPSKARERFEDADRKKPNVGQLESDLGAPLKPAFVIVDHDISPNQARNIERATGVQVMDRTGVIVKIFDRHAHSREAKLQVEMARLKYIAPRLRESSSAGERRQGYGAGESDLELERRKIRGRIAELKEQLEAIQRDSEHRRAARQRGIHRPASRAAPVWRRRGYRVRRPPPRVAADRSALAMRARPNTTSLTGGPETPERPGPQRRSASLHFVAGQRSARRPAFRPDRGQRELRARGSRGSTRHT